MFTPAWKPPEDWQGERAQRGAERFLMIEYTYHNYEQLDPRHQPLYLSFVLRHLRSDPSIRRVLDAGCGDGNFAASVADAGFEVCGIDASEGGIRRAKSLYPQIQFAEGSVYSDLTKPFQSKQFDAIISIEVIEHLYSPRTFVLRVNEALRPGGLFIITTPYWGYLKNILLAITDRMDRALNPMWEGGHIKHWSYKKLRELLETSGFEYLAFKGAGRPIPYCWMGMAVAARKRLSDLSGGAVHRG